MFKKWAFAALCLLVAPYSSYALEKAKLEIPSQDPKRLTEAPPIEGLKWNSQELDIQTGYSRGASNYFVTLTGEYRRPMWKLYYQLGWQDSPNEIDTSKPFSIEVPYTGPKTPVHLISVTPDGNAESQTYHVVFPDELNLDDEARFTPSPHRFSPGLGVSQSWYSQSNGRSLQQLLLTFKGAYSYTLVPRKWELGANLYFSLVPLASSIQGTWARFMGINVRGGYLKDLDSRWTLGLNAGGYYTTMFVSQGARLGFEKLTGPHLTPTLRYQLNSRMSLTPYFKFAPVSSGTKISISDRELALGVSWTRMADTGRPFSLSLDLADLKVTIKSVLIRSRSASLMVSHAF